MKTEIGKIIGYIGPAEPSELATDGKNCAEVIGEICGSASHLAVISSMKYARNSRPRAQHGFNPGKARNYQDEVDMMANAYNTIASGLLSAYGPK